VKAIIVPRQQSADAAERARRGGETPMEMSGQSTLAATREGGLGRAQRSGDPAAGDSRLRDAGAHRRRRIRRHGGPEGGADQGQVSRPRHAFGYQAAGITGQGQGGVAGFAEGGATVRLEAVDAAHTILHYDVRAKVGGKIAQLGARLIDSTAKKLAGQFFDKFGELVGNGPEQSGENPAPSRTAV
jgi:hypothetical protein